MVNYAWFTKAFSQDLTLKVGQMTVVNSKIKKMVSTLKTDIEGFEVDDEQRKECYDKLKCLLKTLESTTSCCSASWRQQRTTMSWTTQSPSKNGSEKSVKIFSTTKRKFVRSFSLSSLERRKVAAACIHVHVGGC